MKKILALALALMLAVALFAACGDSSSSAAPAPSGSEATSSSVGGSSSEEPTSTGGIAKEDLLIGVVHIMELGDQGYTFNHDQGVKEMLTALGLTEAQYIPKFNINDTDKAATTAAINELLEAGCQIIFTTSYSYGDVTLEMAKEHPEVTFCHATGTYANDAGLSNFHNYFAKIHQARYLAGIAAGLKAAEIGNNKLGYVAAYPYAEVISGYTAFFLGARSVNADVTMDVMYIDSWGDAVVEQQTAEALINRGCGVISQHSDSLTPAIAAESKGAFHVGYNNDMAPDAPNASIVSARIDWGIYMTYAVQCVIDGTPISTDWSEGLESGAVYLSPLNTAIAAEGTQEAIDAATQEFLGGKEVFAGALVDKDGNPAQITNFDGDVVFTFEDENSVFVESDVTSAGTGYSAPSFNAIIEGISEV